MFQDIAKTARKNIPLNGNFKVTITGIHTVECTQTMGTGKVFGLSVTFTIYAPSPLH